MSQFVSEIKNNILNLRHKGGNGLSWAIINSHQTHKCTAYKARNAECGFQLEIKKTPQETMKDKHTDLRQKIITAAYIRGAIPFNKKIHLYGDQTVKLL